MLAPETIQNALVSKLQAIPALVALLSSSATISAYVDEWPGKVDLLEAVRDLPEGSILIAHQETGPGQLAKMETWRHRLSLYVKPKGKMSDIWAQIVNGIPTNGDGLKMLYTESLDAALHRMNVPTIRRQFLSVDQFTVIDYFEISVTFDEKGS